MSALAATPGQTITLAPPYPAALSIFAPTWRSSLTRDGQVYLSLPVVHIGLLETNDVILSAPGVSRLHAVIRWTAAGYVIEDLGSTNGTFVQGQRITTPTLLVPGQRIRVGNVEMVFQAVDTQAAPAGTTPQPIPFPVQPHPSRFRRWLRAQGRKRYWKIFLIGLLAYIVSAAVLSATDNLHMVPLVLLIASMLVPVSFVTFCWEEGAFADMPAVTVGLTFVSGSIVGLLIAAVLEEFLVGGTGFGSGLLIGLCEESAKVIAVLWFLRDRRLRSELDGLVLGAAAGMGFAALETAGYGFTLFLRGALHAIHPGVTLHSLLVPAIEEMNATLVLRMLLALFGHGLWTAIVVSAIWRDRGAKAFRLTGGVILAFAIAVLLHALWDTSPLFMPLDAIVGAILLRFFIKESVERQKLGSMAPPPEPLGRALLHYLTHIHHRTQPHPAAPAVPAHPLAFAGYGSLPAQAVTNAAPVAPGPAQPAQTVRAPAPGAASGGGVTTVLQPADAAFCAQCGAPHTPGALFCGRCGSPYAPPS